jgi:hypothetical protein
MVVRLPHLSSIVWSIAILGGLALIAGVVFSPAQVPKANALGITTWKGYFTGYNYQSYLSCSDDCAGDVAPNHFAGSYNSSAGSKQAFVSAVEDADSQYGFSAAPFFINAMMGEPYGTTSLAAEGQWANIIESSAISLNIGSYTGCQNSASVSKALDPNKQNDFVFTDACVSGASDILIQNASGSVTYAQIKISCGNFVGSITTLPTDTPPTGSISVGCNADGTAYAIVKFSDQDGPTTADLTVNFAGSSPPNQTYNLGTAYSNNQDHTYQIPAPNTDFAGAWGATLLVYDNGGSQNRSYSATSGTCDKPPTGSVSAGCNADGSGWVKLNFSDPNGNNSAKLTVNYGAGNNPATGVFNYGNSGAYTRTIPIPDADNPWSVTLLVYDYGGPDDMTYTANAADCDKPPTGTLTLSCNPDGTGTIKLSFSDPNGDNTAKLTVNYGAGNNPATGVFNYGDSGSYTRDIPAPDPDNPWSATLLVYDYGGSHDLTITKSSSGCDEPPTGTLTLSCNPDGTGTIKLSFSDPNGDNTAKLTVNYGAGNNPATGVFNYGDSGSYTRTVSAIDAAGAWSATLLVYDYGGPNNVTIVKTSPTCNLPPVGTVQAAAIGSCNAVRVDLHDPNTPTGNINYYLAIDGYNKGPELTAPENTLTPPTSQAGTGVTGYQGFDSWKQNKVDLYGVDTTTHDVTGVLASVTLPVCGKISCNAGMTSLDPTLVAGMQTTFTVWVTVQNATNGPPGAKFTSVTMTNPNGQTTTIVPPPAGGLGYTGTTTLYDSSNGTTAYLLPYTPEVAGTYNLSWTFGGGESNPPAVTCAATAQAQYEPYFTVLGGDVSAGEGFGGSCTTNTNAEIAGYNMDGGASPHNYFGASARQGALATGNINQFATDMTNFIPTNLGGSSSGLASPDPGSLAFANAGTSGTTYGGEFLQGSAAGLKWCVPDYVATVTGTTTATTLPANLSALTANPNGYIYRISGDQTLGGFSLQPGVHVTVVVTNGSALINGNITYAAYNGVSNVPQFSLIVNGGDIYIQNTVTDTAGNAQASGLHGLYVAEPTSASNGTIVTCATAIGHETTDYNTCDQSLTFYGAVAARQIDLDRTLGNVAKLTNGMDPSHTAAQSDYPAEQFIYTPELWLGAISGPVTSCAVDPTQPNCLYQSYTSLPPVL